MKRSLLLSAALLMLPLGAQAQSIQGDVGLDRPTPNGSSGEIPTDPITFNGGDSVTITQSSSLFVKSGGVSCAANDGTYTTENSYWRVFDLADYPEITADFTVTEVGVGVAATDEWDPSIPEQTTVVNLYTLSAPPSGTGFPIANLTLVGTAEYLVYGPDLSDEVVPVPVDGTFAPTDLLVVEWFTPSGNPEDNPTIPAGTYFDLRAGVNAAGETAENYISSASCVINDPVTMTSIGFPDTHWVLTVTGNVGGVANEDGAVVRNVTIGDAYPNPAAGRTVIPFSLEEASQVRVAIYDVRGREVAVIANGPFAAGAQSVAFDASRLPSGTYVYRVDANGQVLSQQMVVLD